ncbi:hypothetical protein ACIPPJ_35445 [Streptomyces sp. NPDC086091]|uniref:hypothetical protein n=1 Tax=Streptomyces TaxID=1883 RepID=UPI0029A80550|nr:hypothetical protein [Streptomyces caniscabiei]MDX3733697.1 hypothetical protein [Streptomyces caniscabiei]
MTKPVIAHPGRGIRVESVRLVQHTGEIDEYTFRSGMLNIITGVRNSSKTTTLKAIDYCLGDRDSPRDALTMAVAEKYVEISTDLTLNGRPHELTRSLQHGRLNKVYIDGDDLNVDAFSSWILRELDWPDLQIPKGIVAESANQLTPLSFRNTLRHIYRNEDSWTDFANKEAEFIRRAVVSQLLGFARVKYSNKDFHIAQARKRLAEAQAVEREVQESTLQAVTAISDRLNIPVARSLEQVAAARDAVRAELDAAYEQRRQLTADINNMVHGGHETTGAGYDTTLTTDYENTSRRLQRALDEVTALEQLHHEHEQSAQTVTAEIGRMQRLITSVELFDALPVRLCPACEQNVDPRRPHDDDACYLCNQPVSDDQRRRRAQVEVRSLESELADLQDVITRTAGDLQTAHDRRTHLEQQQAELAKRINNERAAQLAPFMTALEDLAGNIAQLEQKMTAFPAIEEILQRRIEATQTVASAQQALNDITEAQPPHQAAGLSPADRCALFADRMNSFLQTYRGHGWVKGSITISDSDLTFYVGTRPWNQILGAELRVLFFLAYSYATLFLANDLDEECAFPGFLMLDNPYQQGIDASVIKAVLQDLGEAAQATGTQVITTQALPEPLRGENIRHIKMPQVYEAN